MRSQVRCSRSVLVALPLVFPDLVLAPENVAVSPALISGVDGEGSQVRLRSAGRIGGLDTAGWLLERSLFHRRLLASCTSVVWSISMGHAKRCHFDVEAESCSHALISFLT